MINTDKYEEFENAMNEGRIERVHCLWALAEVKRLRKGIIDIADKWERPSILRGFLKELKELIE